MIIRKWACDDCGIQFDTHENQEPTCRKRGLYALGAEAMNIGSEKIKTVDRTMRGLA